MCYAPIRQARSGTGWYERNCECIKSAEFQKALEEAYRW